MKYLDDNGASRLLDVIKAYADRKVAEVDLRKGGSVEGMLSVTDLTVNGGAEFNGIVSFGSDIEGFVSINGGLSAQWIEPWEGTKWGINIEGDAHFINIAATDGVSSPYGVFDHVEIGEIPVGIDRSISLLVGSGGIGTLGSITANGTVWANELVVWDSALFDSGANFEGPAIFNADAEFSTMSVLGSIYGFESEANAQTWKIYPTGRAEFEQVDVYRFSSAEYADFNDVDFNGSVNAFDVYFHDIISGYKDNTLTWYIDKFGYAKFNRVLDISRYYQISNIEEFEENIIPAVLETFRLGPGMQNIEPDKIRVLGYFEAGNSLAFVRFTVGFAIDPSSCNFAPGADKIIGARLTADGETVLMIPVFDSPAPIGFFEYSLPFNSTNGSFLAAAKYKLEVVLGSSSQ